MFWGRNNASVVGVHHFLWRHSMSAVINGLNNHGCMPRLWKPLPDLPSDHLVWSASPCQRSQSTPLQTLIYDQQHHQLERLCLQNEKQQLITINHNAFPLTSRQAWPWTALRKKIVRCCCRVCSSPNFILFLRFIYDSLSKLSPSPCQVKWWDLNRSQLWHACHWKEKSTKVKSNEEKE